LGFLKKIEKNYYSSSHLKKDRVERSKMIEKNYIIIDEAGIHARPSTALVSAVSTFKSEVKLEYKERQVNLKSIMGVMSLGIPKGASVKVIAQGEDESQVIERIDEVMEKEGLSR
jgi:phosphocarrier protein